MSESVEYDVAILGAGPGGYHAAVRAAQYGAKVALIEKANLGGTCLNWGCIPTKALYASADLIQTIREHGESFGVNCDAKLNFAKAVERKNNVVKELVEGIAGLQKAWKNDVYFGYGKILGGNANEGFDISIEGKDTTTIKAKRVIIATGSSPAMIPAFNIDHERILTSDDAVTTINYADANKDSVSNIVTSSSGLGRKVTDTYDNSGATTLVITRVVANA